MCHNKQHHCGARGGGVPTKDLYNVRPRNVWDVCAMYRAKSFDRLVNNLDDSRIGFGRWGRRKHHRGRVSEETISLLAIQNDFIFIIVNIVAKNSYEAY